MDFKQEIRCLRDQSPALSGKCHRDGATLRAASRRQKDVPAVAGSGDGNHNVPLVCEGLNLALEDVLVTVVVAGGSKDRGIRRESDRRNSRAIVAKANHKLAIEVLRVGRAAAVPAPENFASHANGEDHLRRNLIEDTLLVVEGPG